MNGRRYLDPETTYSVIKNVTLGFSPMSRSRIVKPHKNGCQKLREASRLVWIFFAVWRQSPCGDRGTEGIVRPVPTASHIYSAQTHRLFVAFV